VTSESGQCPNPDCEAKKDTIEEPTEEPTEKSTEEPTKKAECLNGECNVCKSEWVENGKYFFHKIKNGKAIVTVVTDRPTAFYKELTKLKDKYWKANRTRFKKEMADAFPKILELASKMPWKDVTLPV